MSSYKEGGWDKRYIIQKRNGEPIDPKAIYFVLRLDKDPHALVAMKAYGKSVAKDNRRLSQDIQGFLGPCRMIQKIQQDGDK